VTQVPGEHFMLTEDFSLWSFGHAAKSSWWQK